MTTIDIARRRAPIVLAVLVASCLIAACGSSSSTSKTTSASASGSSTSTTSTTGSGSSRFTKLESCLKSHGVTLPTRRPRTGTGTTPGAGGPPPGAGRGFFGGGAGGFASRNPKLAAAMKACGANFGAGAGRRFQLSHTAITKYVTCVRQHGYNLPNPNFSGKGPVFPASIESNKKFQTASKACQSLLAAARPGRTSTTPTS